MRIKNILFIILIQLAITAGLMSQTSIMLTFSAETDSLHQPLDSVVIENLTQGGDTVLIYPDTLLLLEHGIGVRDLHRNQTGGLILYPSFPNPFTGRTTARFFLPESDIVTIRVSDLLGREVGAYQQSLPEGEHTFTLYPGSERYYLLVVETPRYKRVQKLINLGGGSALRIECSGSDQNISGLRLGGKSAFIWAPGDQLQFTGYAVLPGSVPAVDTIADDPVTSSLYTFNFTLLPHQPSPILGDTLPCENDTSLIYSVVYHSGITYSWSVPTGWSITAGQGTHEITVTVGSASGIISVIPLNSTGQGPAQSLAVSSQVCPYPPGYVHCNPANPTIIVNVFNPITGKTWMDRNLGASQVATSYNDTLAYGDLFQWGRFADGHQCRTSTTINTTSSANQTGHGFFISGMGYPYDWRNPQDTSMWQGVNGINNPCPTGYRLPTEAELDAERQSWSSTHATGAYGSPLKLPMAGYRYYSNGLTQVGDSNGGYWSSSVQGINSRTLYIYQIPANVMSFGRANGFSVRCITDILPPQPSPINGVTNPCENQAGLVYSVTQNAGVIYIWTVPSGWSITSGQGTNLIIVNAGTLSGFIEVTPSNAAGNGPIQTLAVTAQMCPTPTYPPGYVHCNPSFPTAIVDVTNPSTGKIWMDRNLGAFQVANSYFDNLAYGDLYQWGRFADGHQCRNSSVTSLISTSDQPGHWSFIIAPNFPNDWRSPQNTNLWQGVSGINNPCPTGYRMPTEAEWDAERLSWYASHNYGAFLSPLKLTIAGLRYGNSGLLLTNAIAGHYWSSTFSGTLSNYLYIDYTSATTYSLDRAGGMSVRCIKY